jgi:hypothetical protein
MRPFAGNPFRRFLRPTIDTNLFSAWRDDSTLTHGK